MNWLILIPVVLIVGLLVLGYLNYHTDRTVVTFSRDEQTLAEVLDEQHPEWRGWRIISRDELWGDMPEGPFFALIEQGPDSEMVRVI